MFWTSFGSRLKIERKKQKLTQAELGKMIGTEKSYISHLERGAKIPSLKVFIDIALALETNPDNLLDNTEELKLSIYSKISKLSINEYKFLHNSLYIMAYDLYNFKFKNLNYVQIGIRYIGLNLEKIRKGKGLKIDHISTMLDISDNTYYKIEKGDVIPNIDKFIDIIKILNVSPLEILLDGFSLHGDILFDIFNIKELKYLTNSENRFLYEHTCYMLEQMNQYFE